MAHFIFDKEGNKLDSLTPKSKIEEPAKQTREYNPINIRDLANRYLYKENVAQLEEYAKNLLASSDITEERLKNRTINYAFNKNLLDFINSAIMPKDERLKQYKNFLQLVQVKNILKKKGNKKDANDVAMLATGVNKDGTVKKKLTAMQRAKLHQDTLARTVNWVNWDDWAERLLPENMLEEYKQATGNRLNINKRDAINSILKSYGIDEDVLPVVTLIIGNKKGKSYYTINDWREHIDNVNKYKDLPHYDFDEVTRQWKPKSALTPEDVNDEDDRPADWWPDPIYDNPEDDYTQEDIDKITATLKANPKYHHGGSTDMPVNIAKVNKAFTNVTGIDEPQLKYNRKDEEDVQTKEARTKYGKTLTKLGYTLKPGKQREKTVPVSKEVLDVLLNTHDNEKK